MTTDPAKVIAATAKAGDSAQAAHDHSALPAAANARNQTFTQSVRALRGSASLHLKNGESIPPFTLINDKGQLINAPEAWAGKYVMLNFIFTRCQIPSMCPAATAQMTAMQRKLAELGLADNVQLVSVTFDPEHDSPQVLAAYAKLFAVDGSNFDFLTGPADIISAVLQRFAIITRKSDGTINHTMTTTLISPEGAIISQAAGPSWPADNFIRQIREDIAAREAAAQPPRPFPAKRR